MLQTEKHKVQLMDINEVAHFLEISSATVRNWIKHNYLAPATTEGKMRFVFQDVHSLKENLLNGKTSIRVFHLMVLFRETWWKKGFKNHFTQTRGLAWPLGISR
jgi:hypothetical protein